MTTINNRQQTSDRQQRKKKMKNIYIKPSLVSTVVDSSRCWRIIVACARGCHHATHAHNTTRSRRRRCRCSVRVLVHLRGVVEIDRTACFVGNSAGLRRLLLSHRCRWCWHHVRHLLARRRREGSRNRGPRAHGSVVGRELASRDRVIHVARRVSRWVECLLLILLLWRLLLLRVVVWLERLSMDGTFGDMR